METGKAMGCSRHMWGLGEKERSYFDTDSGCPFCALEERWREQVKNAERGDREQTPEIADYWWQQVWATEERLVALHRLQEASLRAISPPRARKRSTAAGH